MKEKLFVFSLGCFKNLGARCSQTSRSLHNLLFDCLLVSLVLDSCMQFCKLIVWASISLLDPLSHFCVVIHKSAFTEYKTQLGIILVLGARFVQGFNYWSECLLEQVVDLTLIIEILYLVKQHFSSRVENLDIDWFKTACAEFNDRVCLIFIS